MRRPSVKRLVLLMIALISLIIGCSGNVDRSVKVNEEQVIEQQEAEVVPEVQPEIVVEAKEMFPYLTEDGKLEIQSLFQFTGFNPDCNEKEGEDIAALHVKNASNEHLTYAEITIMLEDGQNILFVAKELPPQQSMMVFSKENISYDGNTLCEKIAVESMFENSDTLLSNQLTVRVEEMVITVTNMSEDFISDLIIKCHCMLETDSFGGRTYDYPVDSIAPGESVTIEAYECYMGSVLVVKIAAGN